MGFETQVGQKKIQYSTSFVLTEIINSHDWQRKKKESEWEVVFEPGKLRSRLTSTLVDLIRNDAVCIANADLADVIGCRVDTC
jgi:hypothetical protein